MPLNAPICRGGLVEERRFDSNEVPTDDRPQIIAQMPMKKQPYDRGMLNQVANSAAASADTWNGRCDLVTLICGQFKIRDGVTVVLEVEQDCMLFEIAIKPSEDLAGLRSYELVARDAGSIIVNCHHFGRGRLMAPSRAAPSAGLCGEDDTLI